jgi:hypothetical protein
MTDQRARLQCPLCEGQGQVRRTRLAEFFSDPELNSKIDAYLTEDAGQTKDEPQMIAVSGPPPRDFQREVHGWNPALPMWRRSPKE